MDVSFAGGLFMCISAEIMCGLLFILLVLRLNEIYEWDKKEK